MIEIKNAKITNTMLGYEDHGIMTCQIIFDYGGAGQRFGGYSFGDIDNATSFGVKFIMHVLRVVGVEKWEDLKDKHCRVVADYSKIYKIGNILKDEWFSPDELATEDEK